MVKATLQGGGQARFGSQGLTLGSLFMPPMLSSKLGSQLPVVNASVYHP